MRESASPAFWTVLAEFPHFMLQLFVHPRRLLRSLDFEDPLTFQRLLLYAVLWLAILVAAFSNSHVMAGVPHPLYSTFKGIMMRAHDRSWDWLSTVYTPFNIDYSEAKVLWDNLLTPGFLTYTLFASLVGLAAVARVRTRIFGIRWEYALGTGLLAHLALVSCLALAMVPLTLLLICRHCVVRGTLYLLLNVAGWWYFGYYTLGDLGERRYGFVEQVFTSIGYGFLQFAAAYIVFFALIVCIIPM